MVREKFIILKFTGQKKKKLLERHCCTGETVPLIAVTLFNSLHTIRKRESASFTIIVLVLVLKRELEDCVQGQS